MEEAGIRELIASRTVRAVYQPIVDLDRDEVVGYEALARGPAGSALESPGALFPAATAAGVLGELDRVCRDVALDGALDARLGPPRALFVNVEPSALGRGELFSRDDALREGRVRVIAEFTERALAARPAEVLAAVDWLRARGCGIALDDVGVDERSLALLPFLAPDVIKLDMGLIQEPAPTIETARVLNAVAAAAEASGALLLAEGIETEEHLLRARSVGATLGQGWHYGRPDALPADTAKERPRGVEVELRAEEVAETATPFELIADERRVRRGDKRLLLALSRQLEAEAGGLGPEAVVVATFQEATFFTDASRARYEELGRSAALVGALGVGIPAQPAPLVRGADLAPDDPLRGEWDVTVIAPHFAGAFVARDLGDRVADPDRRFDFFLTYDRELVTRAASALLRRIVPTASSFR